MSVDLFFTASDAPLFNYYNKPQVMEQLAR